MPNIIFQFCFIVLPVNARWFCVKERACQLLYNRGATRASSINYRIYFIFAANGLRKTLSYLWRILHLYTSSISCFLSYSCNISCACTISHPVSAAISSTIISSLRLCRRPLRIIPSARPSRRPSIRPSRRPSARPSRLASISYAFHVIYSTFPHRTLLFQYPYSLSPLYTPVKKKQRYFIQEYSYFSFCSSSLERTNLDCFGKFLQKGTPGKRMCLPWRRPFQNAKNP